MPTLTDDQRLERSAKRENIAQFLKKLVKGDNLLTDFDEGLWWATLNRVMVYSEQELTFTFKDGTELP